MTSSQSHSTHGSLSPPISTAASADKDFSLSASSKTTQSSLKRFNDYVQKHCERLIEHESLERSRLLASFSDKEQSFKKQISTLKAIHTDVAGLLTREKSTNSELRQRLEIRTNSMEKLCNAVADANFVFFDRKRGPHGMKQEDCSQESMNVPDIIMCPNTAISSLLSQIEIIAVEINAQNSVSLSSIAEPSPCHSTIKALDRVAKSLLATRCSFAQLLEDFKSADAARVNTEFQNESLQERIALLEEELKQTRSDNRRIPQELVAVQPEGENHICRPPNSVYPTPATQDEFPISLPSPPLEKRGPPIPDDLLRDTCNISRKTNETPKNTTTSSPTTSAAGEQRTVPNSEVIQSDAQSAPPESPIARDQQQTAELSMPLPSTSVQGVKRTSSGIFDRQDISNVSRTPPSTPNLATPSTSDQTNNYRLHKKRRINGAPSTSLKNKLTNETPAVDANTARVSTPTSGAPSASPSKSNAVPLPKTNALDLKSLKFNKVSQPSKSPSTPASAMPSNIKTLTKSDRPFMKPLDLAKKSPQERAALRQTK